MPFVRMNLQVQGLDLGFFRGYFMFLQSGALAKKWARSLEVKAYKVF